LAVATEENRTHPSPAAPQGAAAPAAACLHAPGATAGGAPAPRAGAGSAGAPWRPGDLLKDSPGAGRFDDFAAPTAASIILRPHRLAQVILVVLVTLGVAAVASTMLGESGTTRNLILAAIHLAVAQWLTRRGRPVAGAALMLGTLAVLLCYQAFHMHGLQDEAVLAFPGLLVFASMFGTRRIYLAVLGILFGSLTLITVANLQGWHVNDPQHITAAMLINVLAILSATAYFVWMMSSDLRVALLRLREENARLIESNARIDRLAHHDGLTGLPNRTLARLRAEQEITLARRNGQCTALIFLDLDNFKAINDSLGHAAGDLLLCEVAARLAGSVRASDTVSRQGGDEFLVVIGGLVGNGDVAPVAAKIIEQLTRPFRINNVEIYATCSLGIAVYPDNGADFDTLLKNADVAMYRAKDGGRNTFRFYDAEMNTSVLEALQLISGIRLALANGEFRLHYQPQFHLPSGRIVGAEALIRWRHPDLGMIPPTKFIPVAERSGLINEVGQWVLKEACRQAREWQRQGLSELVVAVNLSPVQFRRDDVEQDIINALEAAQLAPRYLELELTESLLIADSRHLTALLARLRAMGIRFAVDDFGTGYSNLGYLKRFDFERLKVDQSFVRRMNDASEDSEIVRTIIGLAHGLNLEAVAEGVENAATLHKLLGMGCEYGQGYHWSPALPPEEFLAYVRAHQARTAGA